MAREWDVGAQRISQSLYTFWRRVCRADEERGQLEVMGAQPVEEGLPKRPSSVRARH